MKGLEVGLHIQRAVFSGSPLAKRKHSGFGNCQLITEYAKDSGAGLDSMASTLVVNELFGSTIRCLHSGYKSSDARDGGDIMGRRRGER
ncbi:hypothetical protein ElyMa_003096900 [Elysia marginata]|uniref:Uncharacterized protein n=1 Tax=Elysia marginata TaxID=1093978 RepID=A0AAV4IPV7_9GAST|nr:hypothetical protein ElyMa_003096900 [Elysia marginata]